MGGELLSYFPQQNRQMDGKRAAFLREFFPEEEKSEAYVPPPPNPYYYDDGPTFTSEEPIFLETRNYYIFDHRTSPFARHFKSEFSGEDGVLYASVYDYVMANVEKHCFKDSDSVHSSQRLCNDLWDSRLTALVIEGTKLKFSQNNEIMATLLNIPVNKLIVEANPDPSNVWGIGCGVEFPNVNASSGTCNWKCSPRSADWGDHGTVNRYGVILTDLKKMIRTRDVGNHTLNSRCYYQ